MSAPASPAAAPTTGRARRRLRRVVTVLAALFVTVTALSLLVNALTSTPAAPPPGLRYVQAADVHTRVRTWGTSGPVIVLVHGAAETADTWAPVAERLATGYRVVAYDVDGWGYSQRVAPYTAEHLARQLVGVLDALGVDRAVLVGHSSGAAPVAEAALDAPNRVAGLMLLDGDALSTGAGPPSAVRYLFPPPYRTTLLRLAVRSDALIRAVYGRQCGPRCPDLDADGVDGWRRPLQVSGAEDGIWGMFADGTPGLPADRLAGVARTGIPASVVFGAEDDVFPAGTPAQTAQRIGAPAPTLIPQARHLTMVSDPGPVADAIRTLATRATPH